MIKTITEFCPSCEHEAEIVWNTDQDAYAAFCPYHNSPHMPCCENQSCPEEELERVAASAKQAAETFASACESLSTLALAFAKLGEALEREQKQAHLEKVRDRVYGGKKR